MRNIETTDLQKSVVFSKQQIRIIVAGTRNFTDVEYMRLHLGLIIKEYQKKYPGKEIVIVSGGATGADWLGEKYAEYYGYKYYRFPAKWKEYGRAAGHMRNQEMLDFACQEIPVVVAFWDGMSVGTKNMISIARAANVSVHVEYYRYK